MSEQKVFRLPVCAKCPAVLQFERAKADDKIIFTGTLLVVPDASALARAGESTISPDK